jgi:hypothetical protein
MDLCHAVALRWSQENKPFDFVLNTLSGAPQCEPWQILLFLANMAAL